MWLPYIYIGQKFIYIYIYIYQLIELNRYINPTLNIFPSLAWEYEIDGIPKIDIALNY